MNSRLPGGMHIAMGLPRRVRWIVSIRISSLGEELREEKGEVWDNLDQVEVLSGSTASEKGAQECRSTDESAAEGPSTRARSGIVKPSDKVKESMNVLETLKRNSQAHVKETKKREVGLVKRIARSRLLAGDKAALGELDDPNPGAALAEMNGHGFQLGTEGKEPQGSAEEVKVADGNESDDNDNNKNNRTCEKRAKRARITTAPKTGTEFHIESQEIILRDLPQIKSVGRTYWRNVKRPNEAVLDFLSNTIHANIFVNHVDNFVLRKTYHSAIKDVFWRANETYKRAFVREFENEVEDQMNEDSSRLLTFLDRKEENLKRIIYRVHGSPATESDLVWYAGKPWESAVLKLLAPLDSESSGPGTPPASPRHQD